MPPTPTPIVLDCTVLTELARGDGDLITFIQRNDASGQPMIVSALALAGVSVAHRSETATALLTGLENFDQVMLAPLTGTDQAFALAGVIAATGLDPWSAHVAQIAEASVCPVLTLDASIWAEPSMALDNPLFIIEIAEPGEV